MSAVTRSQPDADAVLAKALLNTREHLGLTQQELADIVGVIVASGLRLALVFPAAIAASPL